ncbi:MAG: hypothetical protein QM736_08575 [Vicinamibacterales bacterium]
MADRLRDAGDGRRHYRHTDCHGLETHVRNTVAIAVRRHTTRHYEHRGVGHAAMESIGRHPQPGISITSARPRVPASRASVSRSGPVPTMQQVNERPRWRNRAQASIERVETLLAHETTGRQDHGRRSSGRGPGCRGPARHGASIESVMHEMNVVRREIGAAVPEVRGVLFGAGDDERSPSHLGAVRILSGFRDGLSKTQLNQ